MLKYVSQSYPVQWVVNTARVYYYPWVYNGEWEADEIVPDEIWLGDLASAHNRDKLKELGITHIVSAVYDVNPLFPEDFQYLTVKIVDHPSEKKRIREAFTDAINFIASALNPGSTSENPNPKKGKVFIHCAYGVSRSSTLLAAYLMHMRGMGVSGAIKYIKQKRPQVQPNVGFLAALDLHASTY